MQRARRANRRHTCLVPIAKIFPFTFGANHFYIRCHPGPHKGAFRDRHERRARVRWTLIARLTSALSCGRRSRVVLTPRRWRQVSQKCLRGDGGKQARSPGRARNKLLKPSRAGMPGDPGATVVTNACAFYHCARGCGCNGHPAFPAPLLGSRRSPLGVAPRPLLGGQFLHNSGAMRGENACVHPKLEQRHCEERSDEAIHSCFHIVAWIASLRSQ
jgi:hypothetical protein